MKYFVFTLFTTMTPTEFVKQIRSKKNITYLICQQEESPTTKRKHLQGYLESKRSYGKYKALATYLNYTTIHLEERKGSQKQAIDYCNKSETQTLSAQSIGIPIIIKQGQKFNKVWADIQESRTQYDICDRNAGMYMRYSTGIEKMRMIHLKRFNRTKAPDVIVIIGKAGIGKTRYIYDVEEFLNIYRLPNGNNGNLWFDGYDPIEQKVLLIDDFKGWIKYQKMLQIIDRYSINVEVKGGMVPLMVEKIYITSNFEIDDWYVNIPDLTALKRRVTKTLRETDLSKNCGIHSLSTSSATKESLAGANESQIVIQNSDSEIDSEDTEYAQEFEKEFERSSKSEIVGASRSITYLTSEQIQFD